jgi:transaldolase
MPDLKDLKVQIYADGADLAAMADLARNPIIRGFTTNPTLMCKAGVRDYKAFAQDVLRLIPTRPVSFEVFSDSFPEMERQAHAIASWGKNVFVKIPITNTQGVSSVPLIKRLTAAGIQVNVTALTTLEQVTDVAAALSSPTRSFVSVFAGRVADTGRDPLELMRQAVAAIAPCPGAELIWASPRELLNIFQADAVGCHVITVTRDLLAKLALVGKNLDAVSLETVRMFRQDALKAGFTIDISDSPLQLGSRAA